MLPVPGMSYENIVLAYDGSMEGQRALREGAEVAVRFNACVHFLAVIKNNVGSAFGQSFDPRSLAAVEATDLQRILDEGVAMLKNSGLEANGHLVYGDPVDEIVRCAAAVHADLIVVGHRESSPLARWWRTPISSSLVDKLSCSILIGMRDHIEAATNSDSPD